MDKNTSVPASAKVRILGLAVKKTGVARRLKESTATSTSIYSVNTNKSMLTPVNPRVGSGKDYQIVKFVRIIKGVEGGTKKTHSLALRARKRRCALFFRETPQRRCPIWTRELGLDSETESYF